MRFLRAVSVFLVALAMMCADHSPVYADDSQASPDLQEDIFYPGEPTVTPVGIPILAPRSPFAYSIVTRDDIADLWALSLPDLLRGLPGVSVLTVSATQYQVGFRGLNPFTSSKILILVDGRQPFLDFFGVADWSLLGISPAQVERIEVYRTPGPVYGANAYMGVVNIVTRVPSARERGSYSASFGETGLLKGDLNYSIAREDVTHSFHLSSSDLPAWSASQSIRGNTLENLSTISEWAVTPTRSIRLATNLARRDGATFVPLAITSLHTDTSHFGFNLTASEVRGPESRRSVELSGAFSRIRAPVTDQNPRMTASLAYFLVGYHQTRSFGKGTLTTDAEARWLSWDSGENIRDPGNPTGFGQRSFFSRTDSRWSYGAVVTYFQTLTGWDAYVGARYDRHYAAGSRVAPFASFVRAISEKTSARASYSTAYRAPDPFELYSDLMFIDRNLLLIFKGNPELSYERSQSVNLGISHRFSSRWKSDASLFYNRYSNRIDRTFIRNPQSGRDELIFTSVAARSVIGLEAFSQWRVSGNLMLSLSGTFTRTLQDELLDEFPHALLALRLRWNLARDLTLTSQIVRSSSTEWQ
ncbi:MAG: TonB-dependent receptor plug domain-containing protein, partial [bacterium JZ-2024 1]